MEFNDASPELQRIWQKIWNYEDLTLSEVCLAGFNNNTREALSWDEHDKKTRVLCPKKGCEGYLQFRESKHEGWEPYIGCTNTDGCAFHISLKKLREKSRLHPNCPFCNCYIVPPPTVETNNIL